MMASGGAGSGQIEVDGVMSRPSDPMLCKRTCSWVFAPIAFSVRKSFWKKFLGNGVLSVLSVKSVEKIDRISTHFNTFNTLDNEQNRSRDPLYCEKQKPTEKPIGGLPL
jgi:hypothetical protein